MVQTRANTSAGQNSVGAPSVAFHSRRNVTEGVPYRITPTASKLDEAAAKASALGDTATAAWFWGYNVGQIHIWVVGQPRLQTAFWVYSRRWLMSARMHVLP
jgi:hypothetical protein